MCPQMEVVVRDFLTTNGKLVDRYFELSERIIETSSAAASPEILLRFLDQSAMVTSEYMSAHERSLQILCADRITDGRHEPVVHLRSQNTDAPVQLHPSPTSVVADPDAIIQPLHAVCEAPTTMQRGELEIWLRAEIARVTGFTPSAIDLNAHFDELGIDSLAFTDLFLGLTTHFPAAGNHAEELFTAKSIADIQNVLLKQVPTDIALHPSRNTVIFSTELEIWLRTEIARATGFTPGAIDLNVQFDELGIDSLAFTDLFLGLTRHFPAAGNRAEELFAAKSIAEVMAILQSEPEKIEDGQANVNYASGEAASFKKLTEARIDLLTPQDMQRPTRWSAELSEMRERIFTAVRALKGEKMIEMSDEDSFDDLGLNSFDRETLWQRTALITSPYSLAGEVLMSTKTVGEALALLENLERRNEREREVKSASSTPDSLCRYIQVEVSRSLPSAKDSMPRRVLLVGSPNAEFEQFHTAFTTAGVEVCTLRLTDEGWSDARGEPFALDDYEELEKRLSQTRHPEIETPIIFLTSGEPIPLADSSCDAWTARLDRNGVGMFCIAKALSASLSARAGHGHIGVVLTAGSSPADVAARGVARSLSHEWRDGSLGVSTIVLNSISDADPQLAVRVLLANSGKHDLELRAGELYEMIAEPSVLQTPVHTSLPLSHESVVLLFGGGVGIGAEVGVDLASRYGCTIVALGRTCWDGVDPYPNAVSDTDLAEAVFEKIKTQNKSKTISMKDLQAATQHARRQRALAVTDSRVKQAGGRFIYISADATNEHDVERAIAHVTDNVGKIDAVIHAAGVVEDRLVLSKSVNSFRRVLHTKACSAFNLQRAIQGVVPKFVVFFSSLIAHTGNAGQTDYCAANEVLNAMAKIWPVHGGGTHVVSMLWSVWTETGLAGRGVQGIIEHHSLTGISSAAGVRYFHDELAAGLGHAWVLITSERTLEILRCGPLVDILPVITTYSEAAHESTI